MKTDQKNQKNWAIVCPGLSLQGVVSIKADPGALIAVNYAILHPDCWSANYWALMDGEVFAECSRFFDLNELTPGTVIWTHSNFENAGRTAEWTADLFDLFRRFKVQTWKELDEIVPFRICFSDGIAWRDCTMFTAIAKAIAGGAKTIRLYGVDMGGHGYFLKNLGNFRTSHGAKRWDRERTGFEQIRIACFENGIEIINESERMRHEI